MVENVVKQVKVASMRRVEGSWVDYYSIHPSRVKSWSSLKGTEYWFLRRRWYVNLLSAVGLLDVRC